MLKPQDNELLCRVGPGTPMGEVFRRFWLPALMPHELPENDCEPVDIRLLGEDLVAFRDSTGRIGVLEAFCPHRRAPLSFGRNEECGLRCPYHGWKYDVTGQCVEVPSEPEESGYAKKIKLTNYPLIQIGHVLWTYMGPPEKQPPHPQWEFATVPNNQSFVTKRIQENNWLQAMEGGIDSSHVSFLHRGDLSNDPLFKGAAGNKYNMQDMAPVFEVVDHDGGLLIGVRRNAEDDQYYWRITPWVMPCYTGVPPRGDHPIHGHFWVPIDDESCWAWSYDYHPTRALTDGEVAAMEDGKGIHVKYVPGTYIPAANKTNDYLIDRAGQKVGKTFSGVEGIGMQDASLQESMGPIVDRTKENLVGTDNGIIMARHRLLRAAKALAEKGTVPPGVDPAHHLVRQAALLLKRDVPYKEGAKEALIAKPGVRQTSV